VGSVAQHGCAEAGSRGSGVNGTPKTFPDEKRKPSAMVDVSVREQHGIDRGNLEWEFAIALLGFLSAALKHAAVEQIVRAFRLQLVCGTSDAASGAMKRDLHPWTEYTMG
jgi:hypothetical protein